MPSSTHISSTITKNGSSSRWDGGARAVPQGNGAGGRSEENTAREELGNEFALQGWFVVDELIDYIHETYYDGLGSSQYTDQDIYEQPRKLTYFYKER